MKVLVTGGTGQIGGAIRSQLAAAGWTVFDASRSGGISADLARPDFATRVAAALPACDAIVHCAASLAKDPADPALSLVNGAGTQHVVRTAVLVGARRLIYLSSAPIIGRPQRLPVDEEHPVNPPTAYHASKLFGEHLVQLADGPALQTVSLRLTSPIGPGTPPGRIFSEFVARARRGEPLRLAGRGGRRQNYVDVRDIAAGVAQCLSSPARGLFLVAGTSAVSNLELAERCRRALGSSSPIEFTGVADPEEDISWDISFDRATRAFGYRPVHTLEDSILAFAATHEDRADQ